MNHKNVFQVCGAVCALLLSAGSIHAETSHQNEDTTHADHAVQHRSHSQASGPNGGRLITRIEPAVEFYVTAERLVQITFLGQNGQLIPVDQQVVSAIGGDRMAPTKVTFVEREGLLLSTDALPEGNNLPIILQIKATPDAKTVRERFYLNMSPCPSCSFKEYACICGH